MAFAFLVRPSCVNDGYRSVGGKDYAQYHNECKMIPFLKERQT